MTTTTNAPKTVKTVKTVKLEVMSNPCYYNQNAQNADIQFSLLNRTKGGFKELHYHVKCREYFGDSLLAAHFDSNLPDIYGFKLTDKRQALDETIFSVCIPGGEAHCKNFMKGAKLLRKIERRMGVPLKYRTKFLKTKETIGDNIKIVVVGPMTWQESPLLISLYTFILRLSTYTTPITVRTFEDLMKHVKNNYNGTDVSYCRYLDHIDFNLFFDNYREIIGDAPLTGLDDDKVKGGFHSTCSNFESGFKYDASKYPNGSNRQTATFSIAHNHMRHGIVTFADSVKSIKLDRNSQIYTSPGKIGFKWPHNYLTLLANNEAV
jgi:hypothetical protein